MLGGHSSDDHISCKSRLVSWIHSFLLRLVDYQPSFLSFLAWLFNLSLCCCALYKLLSILFMSTHTELMCLLPTWRSVQIMQRFRIRFPFGKMEVVGLVCLCCQAWLCLTGRIMLLHTGGMLTLEHWLKLPPAIKITKATCHLAQNVQNGIRNTGSLSLSLALSVCVRWRVRSPLILSFPFTLCPSPLCSFCT